ncbi:MAG: hypothetical protein IJY84_01900 [Clostridia bacterium]|nr:hypothetical protein [Clostridia bacterium]
MQERSIKSVAKEAKRRMKNKFWEDYKKEVESGVKTAEQEGLKPSGVEKYFKNLVIKNLRGVSKEDEEFYETVKQMLDQEGARPSDALARLIDEKAFEKLAYPDRERYLFRLSERYLKAVARYDSERGIEKALGR